MPSASWECPVHHGIVSSNAGFCSSLDDVHSTHPNPPLLVTINHVSRCCQMSAGVQNDSPSYTTNLDCTSESRQELEETLRLGIKECLIWKWSTNVGENVETKVREEVRRQSTECDREWRAPEEKEAGVGAANSAAEASLSKTGLSARGPPERLWGHPYSDRGFSPYADKPEARRQETPAMGFRRARLPGHRAELRKRL